MRKSQSTACSRCCRAMRRRNLESAASRCQYCWRRSVSPHRRGRAASVLATAMRWLDPVSDSVRPRAMLRQRNRAWRESSLAKHTSKRETMRANGRRPLPSNRNRYGMSLSAWRDPRKSGGETDGRMPSRGGRGPTQGGGNQSANSTEKFTTVNFIALRRRGSPERAEGRHQKGVLVWRAAKQVDE